MIIDCISDTHGFYPELDGGDLLIVSGDLTAMDTHVEYLKFFHWIANTTYKKRIVIAGNHDNLAQTEDILNIAKGDFEYLRDSGTEFEGLKIWGSPWSLTFPGMNPKCKAFTVDTEEELADKFASIPEDIDILITHSPPLGILDWNKKGKRCGSRSLLMKSTSLKNLKLFVFGHIHEAYSHIDISLVKRISEEIPCAGYSMPIIVNASHVNERYQPVNNPIRVIL